MPTSPLSLEIYLLGPFGLKVDGQPVEDRRFTRRKPKQLVKLLALQPFRQLHRDEAMEMLWPNSDPEPAANNLHKAIHMARHALEPGLKSAAESHFILTSAQQILLQSPGELRIDVEEFERLANAGMKSNNPRDAEIALSVYRGDLLNEDRYEDWAAPRRNQLRELYHRLLRHLARTYESQSDHEQSINSLRKLISSDPADEESHRLLMRLYALDGNRNQALQQYQQCVAALRQELDTEPETATVELRRQIESGLVGARGSLVGGLDVARAIEAIAILPFHNEGGDLEMEYLSDGLTESVINNLSQLPSLRVMAWGTVARFKEQEITPLEVGRTLGVRAVLTGRVIQFADRLIVRAELIDAIDGAHVWGNHYDRNLVDIFVVQEEIAREISENLRLKLSGEEKARLRKRHTNNSTAYQLYLRGRYFWYKRTEQDLRKGIEYFTQAIAADPGYAAAYDGLSDSYALLALRGVIPHLEAFRKAKAAARKALEIDDQLGEAHASLAHIRLHEWDWAGLEAEFSRAVDLNPGHAIAYHWYSEYLTAMGRVEESIHIIERARDIDPLSAITWAGLSTRLYFARRYDEAIKQTQLGLELNPNHFLLHLSLGAVYLLKGMYEEAIESMKTAVDLSGKSTETLAGLARAYAASGLKEKSLEVVAELKEQLGKRYVSPYSLAKIYASLADKEEAFGWLEISYEQRHPDFIELSAEPALDTVRSDPRFSDLLHRVGLDRNDPEEIHEAVH